jgi:hypothetical protein
VLLGVGEGGECGRFRTFWKVCQKVRNCIFDRWTECGDVGSDPQHSCQLRSRGKKSGRGKTSPLSSSVAAASYSSANSVNTLTA